MSSDANMSQNLNWHTQSVNGRSIHGHGDGLGGCRFACFATDWRRSRGRRFIEPDSPTRTPFQRDRDRLLHTTAFRRLTYKTQVFIFHEGDHYRSRMTHSLEVAQIARSICRYLGLDEDLAESVALAHDLGHTPFGHAGEAALDACMAPYGGFHHNDQTFRVVTRLEQRYADFEGLNLSWETLEGVAKHNGPLKGACADPAVVAKPHPTILADDQEWPLALDYQAGPEAQIAALADGIAYVCHDLDDGLRAGFFGLDALANLPLTNAVIAAVDAAYPGLVEVRRTHEIIRRVLTTFVEDAITETGRRLAQLESKAANLGVEIVRTAKAPIAGFSASVADAERALRDFLLEHMYHHHRVNRMTVKAMRVVTDLFRALDDAPGCLPPEWGAVLAAGSGHDAAAHRARVLCDYIAGMTDRFALDEHRRIVDVYAHS